jgi:hypothetical protein
MLSWENESVNTKDEACDIARVISINPQPDYPLSSKNK